jgi:hypothetical protein
VALGIVWACGEAGIQIPFDQASQVVSESCTAGAMQQALLKLRGKQIADGHQIPSLKMAWTRKNKKSPSSTPSANIKSEQNTSSKTAPAKKRTTRMVGEQSILVTLKRAYKFADRMHLATPYDGKGMSLVDMANMGPLTPFSMSPASGLSTGPATPLRRRRHSRNLSIDFGNRSLSVIEAQAKAEAEAEAEALAPVLDSINEEVDEEEFMVFPSFREQGPLNDFTLGFNYTAPDDPFR